MGTDICVTEGYVLTVCGNGQGSCGPPSSCNGDLDSCALDSVCVFGTCYACAILRAIDPDLACNTKGGGVVDTCGRGEWTCVQAQSCDSSNPQGKCGLDEICVDNECTACASLIGKEVPSVCATDGH
eukprot:2728857-Rhodomonas_salina.1